MKYAVEMGWDSMVYVSNFINIAIGIQKLIWGAIDIHTHSKVIS
jgi:hypothetical protein